MVEVKRLLPINGVELSVEARGDPEDPAILLIHGAAASMLGWPEGFYQSLVDAGRYVIRFDHRDTGESTSFPPGQPPYDLRTMVGDALGVLDALDLDRAHTVGISMGGGIGQILAVEHPERVASLALIATSPGGPDLPPPSDDFLNAVQNRTDPDWSDREEVIQHALQMLLVFAGDRSGIDQEELRRMLEMDVDRSTANPASMQVNHFLVDPGEPIRPRLGEVTAPTLIVHGAEDPVFPQVHADVLAAEIPGADLLALEGVAHLVPWQAPDTLIRALIQHTEHQNA